MKKHKESEPIMHPQTGELISAKDFNQMLTIETKRPDGSTRIQFDFQYCPSLTEQHSALNTDLNFLMEKFKPDELVQYLEQKHQHKIHIEGYDETIQLNLQDAKNEVVRLKGLYNHLPEDVQRHFRTPLEFVKFMDNPLNVDKMVSLGLLKKTEIKEEPSARTTNDDVGGGKGQASAT